MLKENHLEGLHKASAITVLPGHAYGSRSPVLLVTIGGQGPAQPVLDELGRQLTEIWPVPSLTSALTAPLTGATHEHDPVLWLGQALSRLQMSADLPVFESARVVARNRDHARLLVPLLPAFYRPLGAGLDLLLKALQAGSHLSEENRQALIDLREKLRAGKVGGENVTRFRQAAFALNIPVLELPAPLLQYGHGSRSRRLDSSFTDETSLIAANFCRNKIRCSALLREAGMPVAAHRLVASPAAALHTAQQLGYPVVVKPADLDGGVGVTADVRDDDELRQAYAKARKASASVLVEKHVAGRDYRIIVFQGKVVRAVERVPAGVTGDGEHSISELVSIENANRQRGEDRYAPLKPLVIDEEALRYISRAGREEASVLARGEWQRFRGNANTASGGYIVPVTGRLHPDNSLLAERVASQLGLDLAGVDLLIPDIERSWLESGAAVCEVNAQPSIGGSENAAFVYPLVLQSLLPEGGRIPVILVLGDGEESQLMATLEQHLGKAGRLAVHHRDGIRINGELIRHGPLSTYEAGRGMLLDREVDALVVAIRDEGVLATGLPFDRFDTLLIAGSHLALEGDADRVQRSQVFRQIFEYILPGCTGKVINLAGSGLNVAGLEGRTEAAEWLQRPVPLEELPAILLQQIKGNR